MAFSELGGTNAPDQRVRFVRLGPLVLLWQVRVYRDRAAVGDRNELRGTVLGVLSGYANLRCVVGGASKLRPQHLLTNRGGRRFNVAMPAKKTSRKSASRKSSPHRPTRGPKSSRPVMPRVYGIPATMKGSVSWDWACDRLTNSHNYLITTVRPDSRPHTMVVWGIWLENAYYFSTGSTTRKAKNLAANPNCVVCNENVEEAVIVEGQARQLVVRGNSRGGIRLVSEEIRLEAGSRYGPGLQSHAARGLCHAREAVSGGCDPLAVRVVAARGISHSVGDVTSGCCQTPPDRGTEVPEPLESGPPRAHKSGKAASPRDSRGRDNSGYSP